MMKKANKNFITITQPNGNKMIINKKYIEVMCVKDNKVVLSLVGSVTLEIPCDDPNAMLENIARVMV